ncbi:MAG: winged helix-turn-helix domain-containing protein [Candidatus Woesearchaeota archaeon]
MLTISDRKIIVRLNSQGKKQQDIADIVGCSQQMVSRWIKRSKETDSLESRPRSGRPTKLKNKNLKFLREKILTKIESANSEYNSISTKQISELIRHEIGEVYSMRHVQRLMHKLGFSLITPRTQHLKHDQEKVDNFRDEFKKNFNRSMWTMKSSQSTK